MTDADAIQSIMIIRDEKVSRIHRAQSPSIGGDWLRKEDIAYYQKQVEALNHAIVYLSLISDGYYKPVHKRK